MKLVLDSNFLISAFNIKDKYNASAMEVVNKIKAENHEVIAPVLQLWEVDAYWYHGEKYKTHEANDSLGLKIIHYDVTSDLYFRTRTTDMACVKGADRVFISLAIDHKAPIITNDNQIHRYSSVFEIVAYKYEDFLQLVI